MKICGMRSAALRCDQNCEEGKIGLPRCGGGLTAEVKRIDKVSA